MAESPVGTEPRRLRLLWVTEEVPDRTKGGGNIRQASLIEALSHWMDVHLMVVGHLADARTERALSGLTELPAAEFREPKTHFGARLMTLRIVLATRETREVFVCRPARRALAPALAAEAEGHDVVLLNHQCLAPLLPAERHAMWLIHLHNVSAERTRQRLATATEAHRRWLFDREAAREERAERWATASYDGLVTVSDEDADLLAGATRSGARGPVWVVPNGVDADHFKPSPLPAEPRLLLSASLNYAPNADGAVWFCEEVLPLIRSRLPDIHFDIVGRQPTAEVLALNRLAGVAVHADVPEMLPWLQGCRAAVVPLRMGTGTRLKALEALAAGRPLVGTSIGLQGLGIRDGTHALVADDPAALAEATVRVLTDDDLARRLTAAGRRFVDEHYRWDVIAERFAAQLQAAAAPPAEPG